MQCSELLENRPSVLKPIFALHTKSKACVCTLSSDIISNTMARTVGPPLLCSPRDSILRQAQRLRPSVWVTTYTNRTTLWFTVHSSPIRLGTDRLVDLLFPVAATITITWLGVPHSSLMHQRRYWKNLQATSHWCSSWLLTCTEDSRSSPTGGLEIKSLRQHRPSQLCPSTPPYGQTEP